ncbi:MAG: hypothetical protein JWN04_5016 [Myxococcaceae bacterium]|nr:hypothetical protein [Myxococcaceae bacterium]
MTPENASAYGRCSDCGGTCRRPSDDASWVLDWRIGEGASCEMVTHSVEPMCIAVARIPSSALPGSYRQLWQQLSSGQRVWWLKVEDRSIAVQRLSVLEEAAALVAAASDEDAAHSAMALLGLRMMAAAELKRVRQPDPVIELSRAVGLDQTAGVPDQLLALARLLSADAVMLREAWRSSEPRLSQRFDNLVRTLGAVLPSRAKVPAPHSEAPRRHVCRINVAALDPRSVRAVGSSFVSFNDPTKEA